MDGFHCWPVKVFSVTMLLTHMLLSFIMIYLTSNLYTMGFHSKQFYKGGGLFLIIATVGGLAAGFGVSWVFKYCLHKIIVFSGSTMTLALSLVLVGKRGAIAGGFGGISAGLAVGGTVHHKVLGLVIGSLVGLLSGIIVGILPLFWGLDINQRYLRSEAVTGSFEEPSGYSSRVISSHASGDSFAHNSGIPNWL